MGDAALELRRINVPALAAGAPIGSE